MQPKAQDPDALTYLLVLDFEATCQQNVKLEPCSEIIEFPVRAIKLPENKEICEPFHYYIKPRFHPKLTPFCTQLTGITQDMVDKGISLEEALQKFEGWLATNKIDIQSAAFVTCGDWDLRTCLTAELSAKQLPFPAHFRRYINVKKIFPAPEGTKKPEKFRARGMTEMLDLLDLPLEGKHHSGIDDTLNISKVVMELIKRGVKFNKKVATVLR